MNGMIDGTLGTKVRMNLDYETALNRTVEALKAEGFGVLTEIDVKDTMQKKLGVEVAPYKILGACNPPLAHEALTIDPDVGLLLPCNVTVRQLDDGATEVNVVNPLTMLGVIPHPELTAVAAKARERLERVVRALEEGNAGLGHA